MKIKDFFLVIAVFCGLILFSSCGDAPASTQKAYTVRWINGPNQDQNGIWLTEEELSLGQYKFDPFTKTKFQVISIPPGCKVRAIKAGTDKIFIIQVDQYVSKGDTVTWHDGIYHIPK